MKHNITWHRDAWNDYLYWQSHHKALLRKINEFIKEIDRMPFAGKGKPEPLRYAPGGLWSRRITREHRIVYRVTDDSIIVMQCRYYY